MHRRLIHADLNGNFVILTESLIWYQIIVLSVDAGIATQHMRNRLPVW